MGLKYTDILCPQLRSEGALFYVLLSRAHGQIRSVSAVRRRKKKKKSK